MGYETVNAEGAFYVFPKIEDENFVKKAADAGVVTVSGAAFGSNGKGHVRMSYAHMQIPMKTLKKQWTY